jgi:phosphoglycolate phosphatase
MCQGAILFDLDGTLLDSLPDIAGAMNTVLERAGLPTHATDRYRQFIGDGIEALVRRALPDTVTSTESVHWAVADMGREYAKRSTRSTRPFGGIAEMLRVCRNAGLQTAVLTNKPDGPAREMVDFFFPDHPFERVMGVLPGGTRKPDPTGALAIADALGIPPRNGLFVGDMPVDMQTARAAGMMAVGALWGYRPAQSLLEAGAQVLVRSPLDLAQLIPFCIRDELKMTRRRRSG